ncbi:MAG: hypothetical protein AB8B53_14910 [Flavobacteriales bacterium]
MLRRQCFRVIICKCVLKETLRLKISALLLGLIAFTNFLLSQDQFITAGLSQRIERSTYQNGEFEINKNLYFQILFKAEKKRSWSYGLTYYQDEINIDSYSSETYSDEWSVSSTTVFSKANMSFAFLGAKIIKHSELVKRKRFNLGLNTFVHFESPIYENEANHSQYITKMSRVYYPGAESETFTTYPETYQEFDAVKLSSLFITAGVTLAPSYTIGRFYISPFGSLGLHPKVRVKDKMSRRKYTGTVANRGSTTSNSIRDRRNIYVFQEFGLTIGIKLNRKQV